MGPVAQIILGSMAVLNVSLLAAVFTRQGELQADVRNLHHRVSGIERACKIIIGG